METGGSSTKNQEFHLGQFPAGFLAQLMGSFQTSKGMWTSSVWDWLCLDVLQTTQV